MSRSYGEEASLPFDLMNVNICVEKRSELKKSNKRAKAIKCHDGWIGRERPGDVSAIL